MQLFSSQLEKRIKYTYARLGVVFVDSTEESSNNKDNNNATAVSTQTVDEQYVAKKSEFDGIIRVKVHDKVFFTRVANSASMGMGNDCNADF